MSAQFPGAVTATITTPSTAGTCNHGTVTVPGVATGTNQSIGVTPIASPGNGVMWSAAVSAANTVTVNVCAITSIVGAVNTAYTVTVLPKPMGRATAPPRATISDNLIDDEPNRL